MRISIAHFCKNRRGTTAVEMAFVLPLFLLLLLGLVECGRAYWTLNSMQLAIDEAGRFAMIHSSASSAQIVSVARKNLYDLNPDTFLITCGSENAGGVEYKIIKASYTFSFVAPGLLPFADIKLTRETRVPVVSR
jgi:Flp pilus assembly protein TadG